MHEEIDYDALKKRGFLRTREDGFFIVRTRMPAGNYEAKHLQALSKIAQTYGRGITHLTVRQGIEIPFIRYDDISAVEQAVKSAEVEAGTSGPRLRATTACPGTNWCKRGIMDTFILFRKIEERGIRCGLDLPHKFKIVISGCPNTCTRAQNSEIGVHGQININDPQKRAGWAVYLGGCGGKTPRMGFKLDKILTDDEVVDLIEKVVYFYQSNAQRRQRLALLIEEIGREKFLRELGL